MDPFMFKANLEQQAAEDAINFIEREQLMRRLPRVVGRRRLFLRQLSTQSIRAIICLTVHSLHQIRELARSLRLDRQAR